jgi:hypothetical protein
MITLLFLSSMMTMNPKVMTTQMMMTQIMMTQMIMVAMMMKSPQLKSTFWMRPHYPQALQLQMIKRADAVCESNENTGVDIDE